MAVYRRKIMNYFFKTIGTLAGIVAAGMFWAATATARDIPGITGTTFNLVAKVGYISSPDGNTIYTWGYANGTGNMQYPGPTLIVNQGDTITVNFTNQLPVNSSIVFPGQTGVTATGGTPGVLTQESSGAMVTYEFTASQPGTFQYHSGTRQDLQVQMGLVGTIIVRPANFETKRTAYGVGTDSDYDHEHLFFLSEMDNDIHLAAENISFQASPNFDLIDTTEFKPEYWFINGRNLPDTVMADGVPWLPSQPYGSYVRAHPGEKVLLRFVGGGVDGHPFHTHGDNLLVIARDGKLLNSGDPMDGADLSFSRNTTDPLPGSTMDGIFQWTGRGMGWDIYGTGAEFEHGTCGPADDTVNNDTGAAGSDGYHDVTWEWCEDHGKEIPVQMPSLLDMSYGGFWSGSPFLGHGDALPPGEGGLNPTGGFTFPWHSHHEKEVVNFDVFPGGMFTVFIVEPYSVTIP